jgi:hypothetical protein
MIVVVTGYVPIPRHPRSQAEYEKLGRRLLETDIPVLQIEAKLEECWLARHLRWRGTPCTHSVGDNPRKNTLAYHIVQAQKTDWLLETALFMPQASVLVWVDLGIFHLSGVTSEIIRQFVLRARGERTIAIPGCWDRRHGHDDAWPNWRFCGGVMVVPRQYAAALDVAMKREYIDNLSKTNRVTWEVNVLAQVEQRNPDLPIWHYHADHDASIFENYQPGEHADGVVPREGREIRPH